MYKKLIITNNTSVLSAYVQKTNGDSHEHYSHTEVMSGRILYITHLFVVRYIIDYVGILSDGKSDTKLVSSPITILDKYTC